MLNKNYNNNFFGWEGYISRKNYTINILIATALYIVLSLVNFKAFEPFIPFKFLLTVLIFMAGLLKLVVIMCILSLVYRRIADFSITKPYQFQMNMKRIFVFLYVVPVLYILCVRYFFDFMPVLIQIADFLVFFLLMPLAFLFSIIFCFIKGI